MIFVWTKNAKWHDKLKTHIKVKLYYGYYSPIKQKLRRKFRPTPFEKANDQLDKTIEDVHL